MNDPVCPACHHRDHDPGGCDECPRCELHYDEAIDWLRRGKALPEQSEEVLRFIRKVADMPDDAMLGSAPRRVLELIRAKAQSLLGVEP